MVKKIDITMPHVFRITKQDYYVQVIGHFHFTFSGICVNSKNWLEPKTKAPLQILPKLSLSKSVKRTVILNGFFWTPNGPQNGHWLE